MYVAGAATQKCNCNNSSVKNTKTRMSFSKISANQEHELVVFIHQNCKILANFAKVINKKMQVYIEVYVKRAPAPTYLPKYIYAYLHISICQVQYVQTEKNHTQFLKSLIKSDISIKDLPIKFGENSSDSVTLSQ